MLDRVPAGIESDEELALRCRQGREGAFHALYSRYRSRVYSTAYRILRDADLSQDATQEIFIKVFRLLPSWDPARGRFSTWLYRLAANHAIDCWRVQRRRIYWEREAAGNGRTGFSAVKGCNRNNPLSALEKLERMREIRRCLHALPEHQKRIFLLHYVHGWKQIEIALCEGRSLGTVKGTLFRAVRALRRRLVQRGRLGWTVPPEPDTVEV